MDSSLQFFKHYNIRNDEFGGFLPKPYLKRRRLAREHYASPVLRRRSGQKHDSGRIGFMVDHHLLSRGRTAQQGNKARLFVPVPNRWTSSSMTRLDAAALNHFQ